MSEHLKKARHWMREADIRSTGHPSTDEMAEAIWRLIRHLESVAPEVQPQMDLENQFATIWAELDRKQPRTAEVQPHRHGPNYSWAQSGPVIQEEPIPEPREETPQSGHTSQGSSSASPAETTPSTPATDTGAPINSIWAHGSQSVASGSHPPQAQPSKTTAPISSTRAEEASRGPSASTDSEREFITDYWTLTWRDFTEKWDHRESETAKELFFRLFPSPESQQAGQ
jgi:hypothetical protein